MCLFPLCGDSGSRYRLVKEKSEWSVNHWGTNPELYQAGNPSKPVAVGFSVEDSEYLPVGKIYSLR